MSGSSEIDSFKSFIVEMADASAKLIMPYFASPDLVVESKKDHTPVTAADKGAEELMRRMIAARYPAHGILGEEFGEVNAGASYKWVLDPVDGTKSFAANNAQFGTLICLLRDGEPVLGAINLPATRQMLLGDNKAATLNGRVIRLREPGPLKNAIVVTTDLDDPVRLQNAAGWAALRKATRKLYTWGDCYGYYLLATGGVQVTCDAEMNAWDILPLIPVLRGAGLCVTDWHGCDAVTGTSCVAAHPAIHAEIIRILNP
jgi:histidinol phosphatase-like enzyme (inositol monophosphatase family)